MACNAGCCSNGGRGQIYFTVYMSHTSYEIAVGGGDTAFSGSQAAHRAAQTGTTGGSGNDTAGIQENVHEPLVYAVTVDLFRGGDDDAADTFGQVMSFQYRSGSLHIGQLAVGSGTDDDLIDLDILAC